MMNGGRDGRDGQGDGRDDGEAFSDERGGDGEERADMKPARTVMGNGNDGSDVFEVSNRTDDP
jgi:hypothetical protein